MFNEYSYTRFMPTPPKFSGKDGEKKVTRQELNNAESSASRQSSREEQQKRCFGSDWNMPWQ
jgi:hypothetical protein